MMEDLCFPETWRLRRREVQVLRCLLAKSPRIVNRHDLMDAIYQEAAREPDPEIIKVFVCMLRVKLAAQGLGFVIETHYGKGVAIPEEARERVLEAMAAPDGRATRPPPIVSGEAAA